jgi:hypothetical protein
VLELSSQESLQLGHHYIGNAESSGFLKGWRPLSDAEFSELGCACVPGTGVFSPGRTDPDISSQQVIQLLHSHRGKEPLPIPVPWERTLLLPGVQARLDAIERRLAAIE